MSKKGRPLTGNETCSTAASSIDSAQALRRLAEERLKARALTPQSPIPNPQSEQQLVHELQVHQIELEMQNEELQQTRAKANALLAQYSDLYDFAPTGYLTLDREGAIRQVNLTGTLLLGVERSGLLNRRLGLFVAESDRLVFWDFLEKVFAGEAKTSCEVSLPREGSQPLVARIEGRRTEDGQECRAAMLDITERKRQEEQNKLAGQVLAVLNRDNDVTLLVGDILHLVKENTGMEAVAIRLCDGDDFPYYVTNGFPHHFVEAERYLCARDETGGIVRDSNGDPVLECMCGNILCGRTDSSKPFFTQNGSFWSNGTTDLLASTTEKDRQARTRNRCNSEGYESVALIPLRSGDEVIGLLQLNDHRKGMFTPDMIKYFEEIGASIGVALSRKQAKADLTESEKKYRNLFETMSEGIVYEDHDGKIISANPAAERLLGLSLDQMQGRSSLDPRWKAIHEDGSPFPGESHSLYVAAKTGKPATGEIMGIYNPQTDNYVWLRVNATPEFLPGETAPFRAYAVFRDITERKRAEQALAEEKKVTERMLDLQKDTFFVFNPYTGKAIRWNKAFSDISGYSDEEISRMKAPDAYYGDRDLERAADAVKKIMERGSGILLLDLVCKNGRRMPFEYVATIMSGDSGESSVLVCVGRNITERKQAEVQIKFQSDIIDNSPIIAAYHDKDLNVVWVNKAYQKATGLSLEHVRGKKCYQVWNLSAPCRGCPVITAIETGESAAYELTPDNQDHWPETQGYWLSQASPVRDEHGTVIGALEFAIDITERKRAENNQKKLEDQLRQSQKLEAIGQLSSGVAHDFNNLLGGIMGHAELLKMGLESDSPLLRHPEDIISCCTKAADLTQQLLTFARKAPLELKKFDLNAFLKGVKKLLDRTIDRRIEIVADIKEIPAYISGDRNQLENAFLNIAINARDAMPEGGRLSIASEIVDLKKNALEWAGSEMEKGPYVKISFTDNGSGMSREIKDRIFEPFFTTKEVGKGTGLGLASVYGCVKQHNGHITVESEPGKGTTFCIYLPEIQSTTVVVGPKDEEKLTPGTGTLLVVDDEVVYHGVISEIFERLGYTVHCCARGAEALLLYQKHLATIDVVILDMNMPEMNGLQCFRGLKKINPAVKVIVSSGYGDNSDRQAMQKEGVCAFVQKPYKAADLAKKIKELIDAPRPPKGEHELE